MMTLMQAGEAVPRGGGTQILGLYTCTTRMRFARITIMGQDVLFFKKKGSSLNFIREHLGVIFQTFYSTKHVPQRSYLGIQNHAKL